MVFARQVMAALAPSAPMATCRAVDPRQQPRHHAADTNVMSNERPLIEGVVANLPLFWGVAPAQRQRLAAGCWSVSASRGASLHEAGSRPRGVVGRAYGSVRLAMSSNRCRRGV